MKILTLCFVFFLGACNSPARVDPTSGGEQKNGALPGNVAAKEPGTIKYKSVVVGTLKANCYLVWDAGTKDAIIIDPGDEAKKIIDTVKVLGLKIKGIYATHGHFDHVAAVAEMINEYKVPFAMHADDKGQLAKIPAMSRMMDMQLAAVPLIDVKLKDGDSIKVGNAVGKVIHTPGHSNGSVSFLFTKTLFSGDTLFKSSIGRTDLSDGSSSKLLNSIRSKLLTLDENTDVFPGHGLPTIIGNEKRYNPFLRGKHF